MVCLKTTSIENDYWSQYLSLCNLGDIRISNFFGFILCQQIPADNVRPHEHIGETMDPNQQWFSSS